MKKTFILLMIFIMLTTMVSFADGIKEISTPESLINKYVNAINNKDWNTYVNLFNSTDKTKLELLEFLNDKKMKENKQGLHSVQHAKVVDVFPSVENNFMKENQLLYDTKIDLNVKNESKFFQNGIRLNTFTFIEVDGKLFIDTVYFNGYEDSEVNSPENNNYFTPFPPGYEPEPYPTTIIVYDLENSILRTLTMEAYLKDVTPNEIIVSTFHTEAIKANVLAEKTYAWYNILHPRYPATDYGADVTSNYLNYQHYEYGSNITITNNIINAMYGIALLRAEAPFDALYKAGIEGVIGTQLSGELKQYGSDKLAKDYNYNNIQILEYYYPNILIINYNNESILND